MISLEPCLHSKLFVLSDEEDDVLSPVVLQTEEGGSREKQCHGDILDKMVKLFCYSCFNFLMVRFLKSQF